MRQWSAGFVSVVVALFLIAPAARAQAPVLSVSELDAFTDIDVRIGDTLLVTTWDDKNFKGVLVSLGADQLTLAVNGVPTTLLAPDVQRIRRQRFGAILGTVIGAGAGAGLGAVGAQFQPAGESTAGPIIYSTIFGAAIGFGIDALVNIPRTVYRREVRVTVAPILDRESTGLSVRLEF